MTPEDQPQKPVVPANDADANRPKPWTPPTEDTDNKLADTDVNPDSTANTSEGLGDVAVNNTTSTPSETAGDTGIDSEVSGMPSESPAEGAVPVSPTEPGMTEPTMPQTPPVTPTSPQMPGSEMPAGGDATPFGVPTPSTTPPQPMSSGDPGKKKMLMKVVILVIVLALVVAAGFFGYKALKHNKQTASVNNALNDSSTKTTAGATEVSTLNSMKFEIPSSALASLTKQKSSAPNLNYYTTADNNCFVAFGTGDSSAIKGDNISEIVTNYLDGIRKSGATVATPTAADPRIFKDTKDSSKTYSMPSLNLSFMQGTEHAQGYYSGALLKGGERAVVETACDNKNGAVDQAQMTALSDITKQLTVTVQ